MTTEKPKSTGLVGRCFVIWGKNGDWSRQGIVRAKLDFERYLVQFFEVTAGYPSTLAILALDQMVPKDPSNFRAPGCFEFFSDDAHLRDWIEHRR